MNSILAANAPPLNNPLAQVLPTIGFTGKIGQSGGLGPFSDVPGAQNSAEVIKKFASGISNILAFLTIIAGLWFGFQIILASFEWLTSAGDKNKLTSARQRLTHAFIGLLLVVSAIAIIGLIGAFFGLDILLTNPQGIVEQIGGPTPTP